MQFLIADTFSDSLVRLNGDEQKAVKTTAFDLQIDPSRPSLSFHRIDRAKDKNFWSVRVSSDIRIIVHKTASSFMLCYVDHHDQAYDWAERRKLETHPRTGAAQLVEIRETTREIVIPTYVVGPAPVEIKKPIFEGFDSDTLLEYGVPLEWLDEILSCNEDELLVIAGKLPAEAAEALLELATGGTPRVQQAVSEDPFTHPDAQRRFRVLDNVEELERALDFPWEKWTVFLHPEQREWVEHEFNGAARVSGSAGTGKTIVALHRAVFLARKHPDSRVLLATYSEPLARVLKTKLRRLIGNEPRIAERIEIHSLPGLGLRLHKSMFGSAAIVQDAELNEMIAAASKNVSDHKFSQRFLLAEWEQVVDAWQLEDWEDYRDVARLGRKTRLPQIQRELLWSIFESVREQLSANKQTTQPALFARVARELADGGRLPYDFAVVDEAQDLGVSHIRFFAALGGGNNNSLFFAGDLGQRIFQAPFSWKSLGVDIRGRSRTLRINYRTSHQIRSQADRLLGPEIVDVDGIAENRSDTISVFNGEPPEIFIADSEADEIGAVAAWIQKRSSEGVPPDAIAVFVRSAEQLDRAQEAVANAGVQYAILDETIATKDGHVTICTMHLAKGLEFSSVAVMACDDEVLPLQSRLESIGDETDLKDAYDTERQLLYVACTRARDHLWISGVEPASEFLGDLTE